ncbi:MAG: PhzF family phenazine biosynthesis protein [Pseudomonadota bacterium]
MLLAPSVVRHLRHSKLPDDFANAGANHFVVFVNSRRRLSQLGYNFDEGRELQNREDLATFCIAYAADQSTFHVRNPFAAGGVYEDPATGAAAAAMIGYLRDMGWLTHGEVEILQGEDMGQPSRILAEFEDTPHSPVRIIGETRLIQREAA